MHRESMASGVGIFLFKVGEKFSIHVISEGYFAFLIIPPL